MKSKTKLLKYVKENTLSPHLKIPLSFFFGIKRQVSYLSDGSDLFHLFTVGAGHWLPSGSHLFSTLLLETRSFIVPKAHGSGETG